MFGQDCLIRKLMTQDMNAYSSDGYFLFCFAEDQSRNLTDSPGLLNKTNCLNDG